MQRNRRLPLRPRDILISTGGVLGGAVLGLLLGFAALIGVGAFVDSPSIFLFVGGVVFGLILCGATVVATAGESRRRTRPAAYGAAALVVVLVAALLVVPGSDDPDPPADLQQRERVDLATGSTISYQQFPARHANSITPIVILHDGPGLADMGHDAAYYRQLTKEGFDVFVYDRAGSGGSGRLRDPTNYQISRAVSDLDAFRAKHLQANRVILVGQGYGARIAAAYAARNEDHVSRMVLTSPDPLDPEEKAIDPASKIGWGSKLELALLRAQPRALTAATLLRVNPRAARAFAGDAEMDARFDRMYRLSEAERHCSDEPVKNPPTSLGYYAHAVPRAANAPLPADDRSALRKVDIPTMVVKGGCDYATWSSAQEYRDVLSDADLAYLKGAGHDVARDEPRRYRTLLRGFVNGRPLARQPYTGDGPPKGYAGPAK